jgi:hypothetical protein
MRVRFFRVIFVLLSSTVLAVAQTFQPFETHEHEGTGSSDAADEAVKQIENLPIAPTQVEIGDDIKDAKVKKQTYETDAKYFAAELQRVQTININQALTASGNPTEVKEQISAFRKEIDDQIHTKFDSDKLKKAFADIKITLPENWFLLGRYAEGADGANMNNFAGFLRIPTSQSGLEGYRHTFLSDDAIARCAQFPQILQKAVDSAKQKLDEKQKSATKIAEAWEKRHKALSDQLLKLQGVTVTSLVASLPWLMAILAAFGVAAILLVRFFPESVQVEWVASGQVIQLLTVVTLLLIILCLALANIIKEETIGTLLGGIGGYVLSQGIGRAAGRAAARSASQPPPDGGASGRQLKSNQDDG